MSDTVGRAPLELQASGLKFKKKQLIIVPIVQGRLAST